MTTSVTTDSGNNQLFIKWLTEWRNSAKEMGSKMEFVFNKALRSLREHPNQLSTGEECRQLKGFGDKLCKRIDERLSQMNGITIDCQTSRRPGNGNQRDQQITDMLPKRKKRSLMNTPNKGLSPLQKVAKTKRNINYIPAEGSGGYAILMALIKWEIENSVDCLGKSDLQNASQEFSSTSMTSGANGSHYNGWHSIKTLVNKKLIERNTQRYATYYLTESGRDLATKLYQIYNEKKNKCIQSNQQPLNDLSDRSTGDLSSDTESIIPETLVSNGLVSTSQTSVTTESTSSLTNRMCDRFSLLPNTYEIVLCIDTREQASGVNRDMRKTALMSVLQQNGVKVEMRTLSAGDFVWIAKQKVDTNGNITSINTRNRKELVLDYVIERKRIDDLAGSIKDRRWDEQKYRLRNCGIRKPFYIIEYFGSHGKKAEFGGIKCDTLDQAIANAQVDGFSIKRCESFEDTIRYLTLMTRYLESKYRYKTIYSCLREQIINKEVPYNHFMSYNEFGRNANKITNFTVKEMFLKHLLQIKGISVAKAKAIVEHYPTLQSLLDAFSIGMTVKDKENLLSSLKSGLMDRNLGPTISRKVFNHYYCCQ
ncbi:crossover junction endonuclease MUS81-like [Oppia nitens]|uniref:crossover junction endonuclease MUS81-like n=1 Tax=Oppia nitens TaxID=1686743 RepID=UPI0023D992C1|nr:crossover junction endonuclease MUS81-like [Oppia nitens]